MPLAAALLALAACSTSPEVFRVATVRPLAELREEALRATPPAEQGEFRPSDLVEVVTLDPTIHLDIRYATSHNLLGMPVCSEARAFLQRPAAEALEAQGFTVYPQEWWHFDHTDWQSYAVQNVTFEKLEH